MPLFVGVSKGLERNKGGVHLKARAGLDGRKDLATPESH